MFLWKKNRMNDETERDDRFNNQFVSDVSSDLHRISEIGDGPMKWIEMTCRSARLAGCR